MAKARKSRHRNDDFTVHVHRGQCRAMSCRVLNFAYSLQSYNIICVHTVICAIKVLRKVDFTFHESRNERIFFVGRRKFSSATHFSQFGWTIEILMTLIKQKALIYKYKIQVGNSLIRARRNN